MRDPGPEVIKLFKIQNIFLYFLIETVLLSTHNKCFGCDIRKIIFNYTLLSGDLKVLQFNSLTPGKFSRFFVGC